MIYLYPLRGMSHLLPVNLLSWLTDHLTPVYAHLRSSLASSICRCMANVFKHHNLPASPEAMAKSFLTRDIRKSIDDLIIPRLSIGKLKECATVRGIEFLDEALAKGNGVIVISGHFHANRLAKYYLRRMGYSIMSVRNLVPKSSMMGKFGNHLVAPAYGRFLSTMVEDEIHVQDAEIGAGLLRRLRENGIVNVHIDASFSMETIQLQFFNELRQFPTGFLKLAELTGVPLVPMKCLGNSSAFRICFEKPICFTGKSSPEIFRDRMASLTSLLESWVLAHPEEWEMWARKANRTH